MEGGRQRSRFGLAARAQPPHATSSAPVATSATPPCTSASAPSPISAISPTTLPGSPAASHPTTTSRGDRSPSALQLPDPNTLGIVEIAVGPLDTRAAYQPRIDARRDGDVAMAYSDSAEVDPHASSGSLRKPHPSRAGLCAALAALNTLPATGEEPLARLGNDVTGDHVGSWHGGPHIHLPGAGRSGHVPVEPGVRPR